MKKERHSEILKIISENEISTQEELLSMLENAGYSTTQATVSRDIKDLGLVKQMNKNGVYCYAKNYPDTEEFLSKFNAIFSHSVISAHQMHHHDGEDAEATQEVNDFKSFSLH